MADVPADDGEAPLRRRLSEFAAVAREPPGPESIPEELDGLLRDIARDPVVACDFAWDALRVLLARKVERVLHDFWRDVPDLKLPEGRSFEAGVIEPLARSLLEDSCRRGPPFTVQRICELLNDPRGCYKSTRGYFFALQKSILVTSTEAALAHRSPATPAPPADRVPAQLNSAGPEKASGSADVEADLTEAVGRKRKAPPEHINGTDSHDG